MERDAGDRGPSIAIVGLALAVLIALIVVLDATGALAAPSSGDTNVPAIVR